jgi:hypothetical protein
MVLVHNGINISNQVWIEKPVPGKKRFKRNQTCFLKRVYKGTTNLCFYSHVVFQMFFNNFNVKVLKIKNILIIWIYF